MKVHDLQGVDDPEPVKSVQLLVGSLPHLGVHVDGIDSLNVRPLLHDAPDGPEHAVHGFTEVLPTVGGDEDKSRIGGPVELGVGVALPDRGSQGIDAGVAGDEDAVVRLGLVEKVLARGLRGREVPMRDDVDRLAVELLRPGAV